MCLLRHLFVKVLFISIPAAVVGGEQYEWMCSPFNSTTNHYTIPDVQYGDSFNLSKTYFNYESTSDSVEVFPIPSMLNCNGKVSAVEYCYIGRNDIEVEMRFGVEHQLFELLTLERRDTTDFRVVNVVNVTTIPTDIICTNVSNDSYCCDTYDDDADMFNFPAANFAFGIIPMSQIRLLRFKASLRVEILVEQFSHPSSEIGTVSEGDTIRLTNRINNMGLLLLQFVITPSPTISTGAIVGIVLGIASLVILVVAATTTALLIKHKGMVKLCCKKLGPPHPAELHPAELHPHPPELHPAELHPAELHPPEITNSSSPKKEVEDDTTHQPKPAQQSEDAKEDKNVSELTNDNYRQDYAEADSTAKAEDNSMVPPRPLKVLEIDEPRSPVKNNFEIQPSSQHGPQQLTLSSQKTAPTLVQDCHYGLLMEQLVPCQAHWERIASGLRFHPHEIKNIRANPVIMLGGPEACLGEVLSQWLNWAEGDARESQGEATLEALKTALDRAGFPKVANSLALTESKTMIGLSLC